MSLEQENFDMDLSQKTDSDLEQYGGSNNSGVSSTWSPQASHPGTRLRAKSSIRFGSGIVKAVDTSIIPPS